jgi:hypothetical protein
MNLPRLVCVSAMARHSLEFLNVEIVFYYQNGRQETLVSARFKCTGAQIFRLLIKVWSGAAREVSHLGAPNFQSGHILYSLLLATTGLLATTRRANLSYS